METHIYPAPSSLLSISFSVRMGVCGVLSDIATLAQLSGLHAVMLIALVVRLLRIPQCETECAKLEECGRKLRALLDMATQHSAVAGLVVGALVEAAGLVDSYRGNTLWRRVRTGRSMEARLRDMRSRLDCLCALVLCMHANLLTASASDTSGTIIHYTALKLLILRILLAPRTIIHYTAQRLLIVLPTVEGTSVLAREEQTISQTAPSQEEDLNPCDFALHDTHTSQRILR